MRIRASTFLAAWILAVLSILWLVQQLGAK